MPTIFCSRWTSSAWARCPSCCSSDCSAALVMGLQMSRTLAPIRRAGADGQLVSAVLVRELGPVLVSLLVAGRNASGIASEIGSMKVTEQIDAMRALGTDPMQKLVTPRLIATDRHAAAADHHGRFHRIDRRVPDRALPLRPPVFAVLDLGLAGARIQRHRAGSAETFLLRHHHRDGGMFLRNAYQRRDRRRGTRPPPRPWSSPPSGFSW